MDAMRVAARGTPSRRTTVVNRWSRTGARPPAPGGGTRAPRSSATAVTSGSPSRRNTGTPGSQCSVSVTSVTRWPMVKSDRDTT